jgi:signal transduction histidine kinase
LIQPRNHAVSPAVFTSPTNPRSGVRFSRLSGLVLAAITRRPRWNRLVSAGIIALLIAAIGVVDYFSGAHVSLRPVYYVPITMTLVWLGWGAATGVSIACVAVWLVSDTFARSPTTAGMAGFWNALIGLVTFLIVVWTLQVLLSLYREMERRVAERTASLEAALREQETLRREIIEVGARERNAVGRELHDGLCQHLTATALATQLLADRLGAQGLPVADNARKIVGLMQDGITQSRQLASGLLLDAIAPERLAAELRDLAGAVSRQSAAGCRFEQSGEPRAPDAAAAAQLLRVAQEAARNAVKHAKATRITIALAGDARELRLDVIDDGGGLPPFEQRDGGMGLEIMAHRAASIGGSFSVESLTGGGTRVSCRLPLGAAKN